jgi:hypothetical protein
MVTLTGSAKVLLTAALFAVAIGIVVLTAAIHRSWPLFVAWLPLIGVGWVLTRPESLSLPSTTPSGTTSSGE